LANETEKIAVEISFRVERPSGNAGGLAQIWNALRESGSVLAHSTSSLIYTTFAIIPWLILILPAISLALQLRSQEKKDGHTGRPTLNRKQMFSAVGRYFFSSEGFSAGGAVCAGGVGGVCEMPDMPSLKLRIPSPNPFITSGMRLPPKKISMTARTMSQ
jgi:hypothetical protein